MAPSDHRARGADEAAGRARRPACFTRSRNHPRDAIARSRREHRAACRGGGTSGEPAVGAGIEGNRGILARRNRRAAWNLRRCVAGATASCAETVADSVVRGRAPMSWFTRWRQSDVRDFSDAIRPELQALPAPVPGEALLERILASRAAGDRIILPNARVPRRRVALRYVIPLAVAASLLMLLIPGERTLIRRGTDSMAGPDPIANTPFLSGVAYAQEMRVADHPSLPSLRFAGARLLRSTSVEYSRVWRDSAGKIVNDMRGRVT